MNRITEYFFNNSRDVFTVSEAGAAVPGFYSRTGLVKRAVSEGDIIDIKRGLYCLAPRFRKKPINTFSVAQRVYGPSYVSLESALSYHGLIPEGVFTCTNVCIKTSREFRTPLSVFSYKRVPQEILYAGVDRVADENGNSFFIASPLKALADYVYIHKADWKNIDEAAASLRIDLELIESIRDSNIDALIRNYRNKRVRKFLNGISKSSVNK